MAKRPRSPDGFRRCRVCNENIVLIKDGTRCPKCKKYKLGDESVVETPYIDPTLTAEPTTLNWIDNFSDWAKSGIPYADYQRATAERRKAAIREGLRAPHDSAI